VESETATLEGTRPPVTTPRSGCSKWGLSVSRSGEVQTSAVTYQVQAAIAACHSTAPLADDTDWREIAALYGELLRYEPTPVHEANRAVAVAMAEGPAAGLVILDTVAHHPQSARWPALHVARADLLQRLGRTADATDAYRAALQHDPGPAERNFIQRQLHQLTRG